MQQQKQGIINKNDPDLLRLFDQLEKLLNNAVQEQKLIGLSAAVIYDQELLWVQGFGYANLEHKVPASAKTVYNIASVSKIFTATMLMMLRDAGKLHLDDSIQNHLPEFSTKSSFTDPRPPTFRQVVAHIAGLPREPIGKKGEGWPSNEDFIANLKNIETILPAYTEIKYSNLGIGILGNSLARIAGQSFESFMTDNILGPLGMTNSGWTLNAAMKESLALGYSPWEDGKPRQIEPPYDLGEAGLPTGGLYTTVEDLARFISLQFRQGAAGDSQILGSTTLREMHAPVFVSRDGRGGSGIGWNLDHVGSYPTIDHAGGQPGYTAKIQMVPELKLGLAVCINQMSNQHAITYSALELLIPSFSDILAAATRKPLPPGAQNLVGRYVEETGAATIDVLLEDDHLVMAQIYEGQSVDQWDIVPEDESNFRMKGGPISGELAKFKLDPSGHVISLNCGGYIMLPKLAV